MKRDVDAIIAAKSRHVERTELLLRHCLSLGTSAGRVPARIRLEQALGPDLASRLIASLTARSRR